MSFHKSLAMRFYFCPQKRRMSRVWKFFPSELSRLLPVWTGGRPSQHSYLFTVSYVSLTSVKTWIVFRQRGVCLDVPSERDLITIGTEEDSHLTFV